MTIQDLIDWITGAGSRNNTVHPAPSSTVVINNKQADDDLIEVYDGTKEVVIRLDLDLNEEDSSQLKSNKFSSLLEKYRHFNIEDDINLGIDSFKEKYLALKAYPQEAKSYLQNKTLIPFAKRVQLSFFLASEFPEFFTITENTPSIECVLTKEDAAEIYDLLIDKNPPVQLSQGWINKLLSSAERVGNYGLYLIAVEKYNAVTNLQVAEWFQKHKPKDSDLHTALLLKSIPSIEYLFSLNDAALFNNTNSAGKKPKDVLIEYVADQVFLNRLSNKICATLLSQAASSANITLVETILKKENIIINIEDYADSFGNKKRGIAEYCFQLIYKKWERQSVSPTDSAGPVDKDAPESRLLCLRDALRKKSNLFTISQIIGSQPISFETVSGLETLELALQSGDQAVFNALIVAADKKAMPATKKHNPVGCKKMINYINEYLKANPAERTIETISFFWNYFGKPFCDRAIGEDKFYTAYYFKSLYIKAANHKFNSIDQTQSQEEELVAKIISFSLMYQSQTMISLNTKKHGLGWGSSTLHTKLEEFVIAAARVASCTVGDLSKNQSTLLTALKNPAEFKKLNALLADLNNFNHKRELEYNITDVDQVFNNNVRI